MVISNLWFVYTVDCDTKKACGFLLPPKQERDDKLIITTLNKRLKLLIPKFVSHNDHIVHSYIQSVYPSSATDLGL